MFLCFDLFTHLCLDLCVYVNTHVQTHYLEINSSPLHCTKLSSHHYLPPHSNPLFQKPKLLRSGFQIGRLPRDSFHIGSRDDIHQRKETYSYTPNLHTLGCGYMMASGDTTRKQALEIEIECFEGGSFSKGQTRRFAKNVVLL